MQYVINRLDGTANSLNAAKSDGILATCSETDSSPASRVKVRRKMGNPRIHDAD
jgi:hypothetical protein